MTNNRGGFCFEKDCSIFVFIVDGGACCRRVWRLADGTEEGNADIEGWFDAGYGFPAFYHCAGEGVF